MIRAVLSALGLVLLASSPLVAEPAQRIVSAGGSITETICALGQEHQLVARDSTSNHPTEESELPNVGYVRRGFSVGQSRFDPG